MQKLKTILVLANVAMFTYISAGVWLWVEKVIPETPYMNIAVLMLFYGIPGLTLILLAVMAFDAWRKHNRKKSAQT